MNVLVLAGGYDQIELINKYKERGHKTILVDYFKNPPAKRYVDKHYQVSTLDVEAVTYVANKEEVDLIITACTDQALVTMAKVSEDLGLPCYLSYEEACNVTNKIRMKQMMQDNKIPTAIFRIVSSLDEVSGMRYPLVVKPVDANSSKGITKVYDERDLETAISEAKNYSRQEQVIVEEYKEGEELSVDVWVDDYNVEIMCISASIKKRDKSGFTIIQSRYPCDISISDEERLKSIIHKIVNVFGLKRGPLLVQVIKSENEIDVIEFSARYGGGTKYKLIQSVSGVDAMETLVELSLNMNKKINVKKTDKHYHMNYVYCNPGTIAKFGGFEDVFAGGLIDDFFYYKTPGMKIEKIKNSSDRAAGYMISGKNEEELIAKEKQVEKRIKVISDEGKNMIRGFLYE